MGVALYVCSTSHFSGKTAICVGMGKRLLADGLSFGYMKPLSIAACPAEALQLDEDARLITALAGQECVADLVTPARFSVQDTEAILLADSEGAEYLDQLRSVYQQISQDRDVVLLEGGGNLSEGAVINLAPAPAAQALQASALVVLKYMSDLQMVDEALTAGSILGMFMLGVVLNVIPSERMQFVEGVVVPALHRREIRVFAVLPQEPLLRAISVREMTEALEGTILCAAQNQDELIENLMVGAMNVDVALSYFRTKPNKAVFTGGDRFDIQLAALETSTRCLVLTGNLPPSPVTLNRAEEVGVPVVSAKQDTLTAVEITEGCFGKTRFRHERKIQTFDRLLDEHFDFDALFASLGLK